MHTVPLAEAARRERQGRALRTENALALEFADRHTGDLRYVAAWGRWLEWKGVIWATDDTRHAFDLVRQFCAKVAAGSPAARKHLEALKTISAVHHLAQTDRRIAATADQWDANTNILNCDGVAVDLVTGMTRLIAPDDYVTRSTAVQPGDECPLWLQFLDRVTDGDKELQDYLQRVAGYAATGSTREHALFFLFGPGGNGKSVFLETLSRVLGAYATTTPIETFMESQTDRHPTELAQLQGARLVTASETEANRRWAESKIKQLTGGDTISARFMRRDFFQYTPQFKLMIAGNHQPTLRNIGEAMRRRLHMIPFTVTIPEEERDNQLSEKLKAEYPGILAWMIDGALEWSEHRLCPPAAVTSATAEYMEDQDTFGQWLQECTEPADPGAFEKTTDLYSSYKAWAERDGERPMTLKQFAGAMAERGHPKKRESGTGRKGFVGVRLWALN